MTTLAHELFPLDKGPKRNEYSHDRGALESMATSVGSTRYVYFVHKKTIIPKIKQDVLTVYDLWKGSASEYAVDRNDYDELKEFYELNSDEGIAIVENKHELLVLHMKLDHEKKKVQELDRIQVLENWQQHDGMKEYRCMRSEKGFTLVACSEIGIRVSELQFHGKFIGIAHTDIAYDGECHFLYTDPWREGDVIYSFESEPIPGSEDERSFNGNLFAVDLRRKVIHTIPSKFPFAPAMGEENAKGVVHVMGVFHRPGHLWVVTQNTTQIATLSVWKLDADGWHKVTSVDNDEYEVTMDVCADGSAIVVLEDEVNGSPVMRNIRHRGPPSLYSLARTSAIKHFPVLRCDSYFTQLFSQRLFK
uniref:DUF295 domain-containing protein n=1 Tax=Haemonchus contortus TaxID=6289 RepID=A0A7I4YEV9_HAECO